MSHEWFYKNAETVTTEIERVSWCCRHDTANGLLLKLKFGKIWKLNCPCWRLFLSYKGSIYHPFQFETGWVLMPVIFFLIPSCIIDMYVKFFTTHFAPAKQQPLIRKWIQHIKMKSLTRATIISNTLKKSPVFISLVPVPVLFPVPDSGFCISCFPYAVYKQIHVWIASKSMRVKRSPVYNFLIPCVAVDFNFRA